MQEGRIWSEETHAGCDPEIVERMFDYRELAEKYNLEVVAGNFFQVLKPDKRFCASSFVSGSLEWVLDQKDDLQGEGIKHKL